jgi:hypothetical protein
MTSEVADLVSALNDGIMTLDEVAQRFRERTWLRSSKPEPRTYLELATQAQVDPDPYMPGSFDDVTRAYHQGQLSDNEYDVLAQAMAQSKQAENRTG